MENAGEKAGVCSAAAITAKGCPAAEARLLSDHAGIRIPPSGCAAACAEAGPARAGLAGAAAALRACACTAELSASEAGRKPEVRPEPKPEPKIEVRPEPKPEPVKEPEAQQALSVPEEPFRIIGEALHTYIIVEQGEAVLFLDKHAAHERIRFEALKKEDHPIMAQLLLAPVSAELSREEAAAVLENRALLERCGFETEDFGGGDVLIRQIPSDVDVEDAKALLQELAGDLLAGKTLDPDSLRDNLLHTIACKSAIKAGWQTSDEELRRLVQEVLSRDDIKYCPHGRPVCVTLTKRQLEKQFKRV